MLFNSLHFLIFFAIVLISYLIFPKKTRIFLLLAASYYFYACWNVKYSLLLLCATLTSYFAGFFMGKPGENNRRRKLLLTGAILINLGMLGFFKYFNFVLETVQKLLSSFGGASGFSAVEILLPMGISFFTFQAIGYVVDVYRGTIEAERNFLKHALFLSFFPQLVAGPIERAKNLLPQIRNLESIQAFDVKRIQRGTTLMLYGYFMKLIVADRAAIFVDAAFDPAKYAEFQGSIAWVAAILFSIQIYCDFAGYTLIAIGAAKTLGVDLTDNFRTPYLARSIRDFWARWHVSLTGWFRDYLYFPLGGSRKGKLRKYLNVCIVFLVSGLWHGAGWHFVLWGAVHGALRVVEELTEKFRIRIRTALGEEGNSLAHKLFSTCVTFMFVTIAWVFFRAASIRQALDVIKGMFTVWNPWTLMDGSLFQLGLDEKEFQILLSSILILVAVDVLKYLKKDLAGILIAQPIWFRWLFTWIWIMALVIFGIYGENYHSAAFIYFQF